MGAGWFRCIALGPHMFMQRRRILTAEIAVIALDTMRTTRIIRIAGIAVTGTTRTGCDCFVCSAAVAADLI